MSLARQHREREAVEVLRAEIAAHPEAISERRLLVRVLAAQGDLPAARREVDELTRRLPDGDPAPLVELGHAYELSHRFEEALAAYDEAAARAPASPVGPREGGMRAARWGETREAVPRLEEAIRRGARDAETYHALGLALMHVEEIGRAEDAYRAGIAADPGAVENLLGLATLALRRKDFDAALRAYDEILRRRPRFAAGHLGRAFCLIQLGRMEHAGAALDDALAAGAEPAFVAKQRALLTR
jgi:tetratricopeptide (TPR) repeat protein